MSWRGRERSEKIISCPGERPLWWVDRVLKIATESLICRLCRTESQIIGNSRNMISILVFFSTSHQRSSRKPFHGPVTTGSRVNPLKHRDPGFGSKFSKWWLVVCNIIIGLLPFESNEAPLVVFLTETGLVVAYTVSVLLFYQFLRYQSNGECCEMHRTENYR